MTFQNIFASMADFEGATALPGGGGGEDAMMADTGRLRPKGNLVPRSHCVVGDLGTRLPERGTFFRYMKGWGFH